MCSATKFVYPHSSAVWGDHMIQLSPMRYRQMLLGKAPHNEWKDKGHFALCPPSVSLAEMQKWYPEVQKPFCKCDNKHHMLTMAKQNGRRLVLDDSLQASHQSCAAYSKPFCIRQINP